MAQRQVRGQRRGRMHWGIENGVSWILDVAEDEIRVRMGHVSCNMSHAATHGTPLILAGHDHSDQRGYPAPQGRTQSRLHGDSAGLTRSCD